MTDSASKAAIALAEYGAVRLRRDVTAGGTTFKAGARGVIVHRHADGIGCEVEFDQPVFRVLTLSAKDLRPDHA